MKWLLKLYSCNGVIFGSRKANGHGQRNGVSDNGIDDFHWLCAVNGIGDVVFRFSFGAFFARSNKCPHE